MHKGQHGAQTVEMKLYLDQPQTVNIETQNETPIQRFVSGVERVIESCTIEQSQRVVDDLAIQINCNPQDLYFMMSGRVKEDEIALPDFHRMLQA